MTVIAAATNGGSESLGIQGDISSKQMVTILKMGGTTMASVPAWPRIRSAVARELEVGRSPVVVCSALATVTNALEAFVSAAEAEPRTTASALALLASLHRTHQRVWEGLGFEPGPHFSDEWAELESLVARPEPGEAAWVARLMAQGELLSTRLLSQWLGRELGDKCEVLWRDSRDLVSARSGEHPLAAECDYSPSEDLARDLLEGGPRVWVAQGYIASHEEAGTALLGRGGSDVSAAYIASRLSARELQIWTDVPGVFTADPRVLDSAYLVGEVSYDEASVLGWQGAKVLHPRCLRPAQEAGIPVSIRWSQHPEVAGTTIGQGLDAPGVRGLASRSELCVVRMARPRQWQPVGFMAEVARVFEKHGLSMDMISSSPAEIRAAVDLKADPDARDKVERVRRELDEVCSPEVLEGLGSVSLVGTSVSASVDRMAPVLALLPQEAVVMMAHGADDSHLSLVMKQDYVADFMKSAHQGLFETPCAGRRESRTTWRRLAEHGVKALAQQRKPRGYAVVSAEAS